MPQYRPSDDEMDDAFYQKPEKAAGASPPKSIDEMEQEQPTALIPKSLLGGKTFGVGEEVVLKIVKDHGDEVEVQYATGEGDEKGEPEHTMTSANEELDGMDMMKG